MQFELEPIPDNADAALATLHAEISQIVSGFSAKAAAILGNDRRTRIQRDIDLETVKREAAAELKQAARSLRVDQEHFHARRLARRIHPATGDTLLRYIEIRAGFRAMTAKARETALQQAIETADVSALAIIDGPPCACGLTGDEHAAFTARALEVLHGAELCEINAAEELAAGIAQQLERAQTYVNDFGMEGFARAV